MIVSVIIFLVIMSNAIFAYFLGNLSILNFVFLIFFFLIEIIIILVVIQKYYDNPIKQIKYFIQKLYTWQLKWEKIKIDKSLNKDLNFISMSITDILNRLRNIKDEFLKGKEIKSEVELAKEIQWKTFEKKLIEIPSLLVVAKSRPAWEIWWDSYDIIKWNNDNYYIYVWDATGHGVWAWFIMIMVNSLIAWFSKIYEKWSDIMARANEILKPRVKANLLMTVLLVRWNESQKRLFFTWAGHEYLMVYKQKTWKVYKIKSGWVALWMIKKIDKLLKEKELKFEIWDIVVLYSDWITEAINKPKRDGTEIMFGEERLIQAIQTAPNMPNKTYKTANSVFNNITIKLSQFMGYNPLQLDDITLAVIQYKPEDYDASKDFSTDLNDDLLTEWNWK